MRSYFLLLLALLSFSARTQTASVGGRITDPAGQPLPAVTLFLNGYEQQSKTNENGDYRFEGLKAGSYVLHVESENHRPAKESIRLQAGDRLTVNFTLRPRHQQLNEVTVQAQAESRPPLEPSSSLRLVTPLVEIPQNIQVVPREIIRQQASLDMLEGVTRNVSGAQMIEHWGNFARINMRGFKLPAFRNGMNVDLPWGPLTEDMAIVDRIEFVKGPSGFMLTAGEPGGFYNVVTKKPDAHAPGSVGFTLGSFNTLRTTLDLGGKLGKTDKLLYRLNVMGSSRGSHRAYEFNDRFTVAPSVSYALDEKTTLTAEYIFQHSTMSVIGAAYVFSPNGFGDLPLEFTTAEPNIDPSHINEHNAFVNLSHRINNNWKVTAQLGYLNYSQIGSSLWPISLDSAGNLLRGLSVWDAANTAYLGQAYLNGKVQTGAVEHRLLLGLDLTQKEYLADWFQGGAMGDTMNIYNPVYGVPSAQMPVFDRTESLRHRAYNSYFAGQTQRTSALYVQDELRFFKDRIRLTVGGRLTEYSSSVYGANAANTVFTPRAGFNIDVWKGTSVYGLYDQAFLPQSGADVQGNAFKPVEAHAVEAGVKRNWNNGRWTTTLGVYRITKENMLTADPDNLNFSVQLGQVVSKGVEFDLQGEILRGLTLLLNYANTDVRITQDTDESRIGSRVAGHAQHMTNGWLTYAFGNRALRGVSLSLGYQYQINRSSWNWGADNESQLPDYFRLDGALGWQNERFTVGLNLNNLLNEYLYSGSAYSTYYYWQTEPGRNYRLSVQYRF